MKQIQLFAPRTKLTPTSEYVYSGIAESLAANGYGGGVISDRNYGANSTKAVETYIKLKNSEKNGLGIPLPAGLVRVYKSDGSDAAGEFIGEDVIGHTAKDEELRLRVGVASELVGERKQTNFTENAGGHVIDESFEIKLRNHKNQPVNITVRQPLYRSSQWEIVKSSEKYEKVNSKTIEFPVSVPAGGETTVTYEVKYTW
jgi:hypothetical protein